MRRTASLLDLVVDRAERWGQIYDRMSDGRAERHLRASARELLTAARIVIDDVIVTLEEDQANRRSDSREAVGVPDEKAQGAARKARSIKID